MSRNHIRVLLITDDEADYYMICQMLSEVRTGLYKVRWVPHDQAELRLLEEGPFDAIMICSDLNDEIRIKSIHQIVSLANSAPSLVLASVPSDTTELAALEAGAADYLYRKEISPSLLDRVIRYAIDRKKNQITLMESEARYRSLFDNMSEACTLYEIMVDEKGKPCNYRIIDANKAAEKLAGRKKEALIGMTAFDLNVPFPWIDKFARIALHNEQAHFEYYTRELDTWSNIIAFSPKKGIIATLAIDITDSKRTEEMLETALASVINEKNRLLAVMEALPVGVAIVDSMGGNIQANRSYNEIWGTPRPEAMSVSDYVAYRAWWVENDELLQPEDWASSQAIQLGKTVVGQFLQIQRFDGGRAYVLNSAAPIRDAQDLIVGSAVAIMDITEQIRTESALREIESRLRIGLQNSPVSVFCHDQDLRYTWIFNPFPPLTETFFLGKRDDELISGEKGSKLLTIKNKVIASGESVHQEFSLKINQETFYFLLNLEPLRDVQNRITGLRGSSINITEQRKLQEQQMENTTKMEIHHRLLELREQERQEIALKLHDGPDQELASLIFSIQFTKESVQDPSQKYEFEQVGESLKSIINELRSMINELRPPSLIRFGVIRAIHFHSEKFQENHPGLQVELNLLPLEGDTRLPEQINLTFFRIYQEAMENISEHAKATQIWIYFGQQKNQIILEIRDNGRGFQVVETLAAQGKPNHLGLAGMRERADAIGGKLTISSEAGKGTTVRLESFLEKFMLA